MRATPIEIGIEMGAIGLIGYLGLLGATALVAIRRAYMAPPGSLMRAAGLGLAAATVCLLLLDFTGTRFRANTVTSYFWLLLGAFLGTTDARGAMIGITAGQTVEMKILREDLDPEAPLFVTVTPATDSGRPASSAPIRATLRLSSPAWFAQPK